jgi:biotin-(acetyl-CoA carboxylase) ligase
VNEISAYYLRLTAGDFSVKEFEDYCPMLGKEVVVLKGALRVRGRVLGVDAQGYLIVEGESGLMRLHHGDVSVRLKSCGS